MMYALLLFGRFNTFRNMPTTLLVEDEETLGAMLKKFLDRTGMNCTWVKSGDEAVKILDDEFDMFITDTVMPGKVRGDELTRIIRAKFPDAPIILMSGTGEIPGHQADVFVAKPFLPMDLLGLAERLLQQS
ncbi:response regulator [Patescibacteria group bacterium]|nr:MAG: response regulator [Patescibacteria group bacterium]